MHNVTYEQALSAAKMLNEPVEMLNEPAQYKTLPTSIVTILIAMGFGKDFWVAPDFVASSYYLPPSTSTFSPFEETLVLPGSSNAQEFEQKIASVYADLAAKQEPLEREFAAVWDANVEQLYES